TRLIGRDGPPDLASDLLQALVIDLPELLDPDLGVADLGEAGPAEAAENVAGSPDREAYDQEAHDGRHDRLAEPIRGSGGEPSKPSVHSCRDDACGINFRNTSA